MRKVAVFLLLLPTLLFIRPGNSVSAAGDQYRRWISPKSYTCTDTGSGVDVTLADQNVEFHSLPSNAQFTLNYIDNGVTSSDGPYTVEQTSGTKNYGSFVEHFSGYPLTFEFRMDTLIGGVVVYQSSIIVNCSGDASGLATIVNNDTGPAPDQYRRWLDDGKTFTCVATGTGVDVTLSNQDVEFNNLPADAQFTLNYIDNGVTSSDGPYTVEQTSGTKNYGSFVEHFSGYPLTFEFRMDTLIGGVIVYRSSLVVSCSGDSSGSPTIVNVPYNAGGSSSTACMAPLPSNAVQGRLLANVNALFDARADAITTVVLPADTSWWVIGARNGFYELWIACPAPPVWVPAASVAPNYDPPWNGAALPDAGG